MKLGKQNVDHCWQVNLPSDFIVLFRRLTQIFCFVMLIESSGRAIAGLPDLKGASTPLPFQLLGSHTVSWGDTLTFVGTVANGGTAANTNSFLLGIYMSTNTLIGDSNDYLLATLQVANQIPIGNYIIFSGLSFTLPPVNPMPGITNFYMGMFIDVSNQVAELNKTNNASVGCGLDLDCTMVNITPPFPHIQAISSTSPYTNLTVTFNNVVNDRSGAAKDVQTITLINNGKLSLQLAGIGLNGSTNITLTQITSSIGGFLQAGSISPSNPYAVAAKSQDSLVFTVQFDPTTNGLSTAVLNITNSDPNTPVLSINLSGVGIPAPQIALTTPTSLVSFGGQVNDGNGSFQTTQDVLIQNNGTGPLTINQNGISLLTGTQFSVLSVISSTQGNINLTTGSSTISDNGRETWAIKVRFDPLSFGYLNDALQIRSNDTNNPTFVVSLQGQGFHPAQLVVSDSAGVISNRTEVFPGVDADGSGLQQAVTNIMLQNYGDVPLFIPTNGLSFNSTTQFLVGSITSSIAGIINLSTNCALLAPNTNETWTVTLVFDPSTVGALTNALSISASNLLSQTVAVITNVLVSGTGLSRASLVVSNSVSLTNNLAVNFGSVLNDGAGGASGTATLTLMNQGIQPLIVTQNGFSFFGNAGFSVASVVSSTRGAVDLTSSTNAMRTIAPAQAEFWTVTLAFDPATNGLSTNTLSIISNDQQNTTNKVALSGTGVRPNITLTAPASQLNVSADYVFNFTWNTTYPLTNATVSLYLDTDTNPAAGLIPIATSIPNGSGNSYSWQASPAFIGTNYYIYATMTDGSVTSSNFAAGRLKIDPVGTFQLLSGIEATNSSYAYKYAYNGVIYTGTNTLILGANIIYVTNGSAIYQFIVTRVPVLAQVDAVQYNQLSQVTSTTNGNGIVTTLIYDQMQRLVRRQSGNGAVVTYTYNPLGLRTSMTDYTGTTFYDYDDLNRLTAVTTSKSGIKGGGDSLILSYEYDLASRETAIVYPGGERIQYTYDNAGRISTVNNTTRSLYFQYSYNPTTGQLIKLTRPNGIETDYSYDGMGRLTNILHKVTSGGALVAQYGYTLDAIGKATLLTTTLPGGVTKLEQYGYDYFDRLTNVIYGDSGVINNTALSVGYTYDGNGNRLTMTTKTNNAVTEIRLYSYGNENRLLTVTNQSGALIANYAYDPAGNRVQKIATNNTTYYSYDERNLMTSLTDNTNQTLYTYNGDAQRVSKTLNGALTSYIIDANRGLFEAVQERNAAGAITTSYTFGATRLATWNGSAVTFELTDRLGSVRLITDIGGNVIQNYNYDAFGANR